MGAIYRRGRKKSNRKIENNVPSLRKEPFWGLEKPGEAFGVSGQLDVSLTGDGSAFGDALAGYCAFPVDKTG